MASGKWPTAKWIDKFAEHVADRNRPERHLPRILNLLSRVVIRENLLLPKLYVPNAAKVLPAGPEQRRHLPPPGDGFGRTAPMFQSVLIAPGSAASVSPAMKPTASPSLHGGRLARHLAPVPGIAAGRLVQTRQLGVLRVHGVVPPVSIPPPSSREPDPRRR